MSRSQDPVRSAAPGGAGSIALHPFDAAIFIGYTERPATAEAEIRAPQAHFIDSLQAYEALFGGPRLAPIELAAHRQADGEHRLQPLYESLPRYLLYYAVKLFFHNGGRRCYVVSVGSYRAVPTFDLRGDSTLSPHTGFGLLDGIEVSSLIPGLAMVVVPEAVHLAQPAYEQLARTLLEQADRLGRRFVLFDLPCSSPPGDESRIADKLTAFGHHWLENAAVYHPLLQSTLLPVNHYAAAAQAVQVRVDEDEPVAWAALRHTDRALHDRVADTLAGLPLLLPPAAAVAGLLAASELAHGIWQPGSEQPLNSVERVAIDVDDRVQRRLANRVGSSSINTLRHFPELGVRMPPGVTLSWDDDTWRFVTTRRLYLAIAESIRNGLGWVAQAPNDADTWQRVRHCIAEFLDLLWRAGALCGARTSEAYRVRCGLGATLHPRDLREGQLHVEVDLALVSAGRYVTLQLSQRTAQH